MSETRRPDDLTVVTSYDRDGNPDGITWDWAGTAGYIEVSREVMESLLRSHNEIIKQRAARRVHQFSAPPNPGIPENGGKRQWPWFLVAAVPLLMVLVAAVQAVWR